MSIEAISEALELLRIAQSGMGPDPGYLDRYDRHHWDRISRCCDELEKLKQQEPAKYEFQNRDGTWHGFLNESHYQNTVEDGSWPIRALYAAPVPAAVPEGWRTLVSDVLAYFDTPAHDFSAEQEQRLIVRLQAMLSAAPAAPAVPACEWSCSDDESAPNTWDGSCGIKWSFIDDGPMENGVRFCPKCGGTVKIDAAMKGGATC